MSVSTEDDKAMYRIYLYDEAWGVWNKMDHPPCRTLDQARALARERMCMVSGRARWTIKRRRA